MRSALWAPPKEGEACIDDLDDITLLKIFEEISEASFASSLVPPRLALVSFRWFRLYQACSRSTSLSFHFEAAVINTAFIAHNLSIYTKLLRADIKELDFTGCVRLKGTDVADILNICHNVVELNISNCFNIGPMAFDNLQLGRLRVLVLGNLRVNMPPFLLAVAKAAPQLCELTVAGCLSFDQAALDVVTSSFAQLTLLEMSQTTAAAMHPPWQPPPGVEVVCMDLPLMMDSEQPPPIHSLHPKLYGGVKARNANIYPVQICATRLKQTGVWGWFQLLVHLVKHHRASLTVITDPHPITTFLAADHEVLQFFVDHAVCTPSVWSTIPDYITRPSNLHVEAVAS